MNSLYALPSRFEVLPKKTYVKIERTVKITLIKLNIMFTTFLEQILEIYH